MIWKVVKAEITGSSHKKNGTPCQDVTNKLVTENSCTIVLADGAGSASLSELGAELTCKSILRTCHKDFDELFDMDSMLAKTKIIHSIRTRLGIKAKKHNKNKQELASTLLFVSIKKNKFIAGHIGDGIIGIIDEKGEAIVLSEPENGEFANTTYFTTSENYRYHLRLYRGEIDNNYNSFFMMSDGAADCLYHKKQKIFAPAIRSFSNWIEKFDEESVNQALLENMTKMFPKHTTDDCSFIMCKNMSLYENRFITDKY